MQRKLGDSDYRRCIPTPYGNRLPSCGFTEFPQSARAPCSAEQNRHGETVYAASVPAAMIEQSNPQAIGSREASAM